MTSQSQQQPLRRAKSSSAAMVAERFRACGCGLLGGGTSSSSRVAEGGPGGVQRRHGPFPVVVEFASSPASIVRRALVRGVALDRLRSPRARVRSPPMARTDAETPERACPGPPR
jgi:hypothetical protein